MEMNAMIIGEMYLNGKSPVEFLGAGKEKGKARVMDLSTSGVMTVSADALHPYDAAKVPNIKIGSGKVRAARKPAGEKKPKLSARIDPYLMEGKLTVAQIADKVKDYPEAAGKNVAANVWARIVSHTRKGGKVVKTKEGAVRVIPRAQK